MHIKDYFTAKNSFVVELTNKQNKDIFIKQLTSSQLYCNYKLLVFRSRPRTSSQCLTFSGKFWETVWDALLTDQVSCPKCHSGDIIKNVYLTIYGNACAESLTRNAKT